MSKTVTTLIALALLLFCGSAHAAMSQCETKESRGLRFTAEAMAKAAQESDPWYGCSGNCQMNTSTADSMDITKRQFEAQSKAALYKARALEANECPQYAEAIMAGIDIPKDKSAIVKKYNQAMQKEYDELAAQKKWQKDHPQCKHVEWWSSLSGNGGSTEDFSGKFKGKAGDCSADGKGIAWHGTEDDLTNYDPDKNDLIAKVQCANVLRDVKAFYGSYADPKYCGDTQRDKAMTQTTERWVIDATMGCRDGLFCFCPLDGDDIVIGMNYISSKPPGVLVGIVHNDGQEKIKQFCMEHKVALMEMTNA